MTDQLGSERVSTGVPGLDEMLGGGLIPGRPYVVSGTTGSGKTILAVQFLHQGVKQGERALLVAIDEPPAEIRENVRALGWDVGKIRILDVHPAAKATPTRTWPPGDRLPSMGPLTDYAIGPPISCEPAGRVPRTAAPGRARASLLGRLCRRPAAITSRAGGCRTHRGGG
jgi:hypothetical protein